MKRHDKLPEPKQRRHSGHRCYVGAGGAGIGWVISEITDVRGEVTDVRKDLADTERRLTEKIQANDARIAEIQQSLIRMETRIDALLDAIAKHAHTEDGVVFVKPVSEQKTESPAEVMLLGGGVSTC